MKPMLFTNALGLSSYSFLIERDVVIRAADGTMSTMTVQETLHNVTAIHAPVEHTFMDIRREALARQNRPTATPEELAKAQAEFEALERQTAEAEAAKQ